MFGVIFGFVFGFMGLDLVRERSKQGTDRGHPLVLVRVPVFLLVFFTSVLFSLVFFGFQGLCHFS